MGLVGGLEVWGPRSGSPFRNLAWMSGVAMDVERRAFGLWGGQGASARGLWGWTEGQAERVGFLGLQGWAGPQLGSVPEATALMEGTAHRRCWAEGCGRCPLLPTWCIFREPEPRSLEAGPAAGTRPACLPGCGAGAGVGG